MIHLTKTAEKLLSELKSYSAESYFHSVRVKAFTKDFLELLTKDKKANYTQYEIDAILLGAILHDIGKVYVRNLVLTKKGKLTKDEYIDIKEHTQRGAEEASKELDTYEAEIVKNICLYHHERIDGSGYFSLTEMPLYVQVVSICDAYDAMISERSYKKGMPFSKAVAFISNDNCGKFSNVMLEYLQKLSEISRRSKYEI